MANPPRQDAERTLRELAAPNINHQPLCIQYPQLAEPFELKSGLIHLLPKFHGLSGEDPHRHLAQFHIVCSSMKPTGINDEQIKLRAFPFSLENTARDWLHLLPSGSIRTWNELQKAFLDKYFPASKLASIRKEICSIRQLHGESLYDYWERFTKLCNSCPNHQITDQLLIQYFYEGLSPIDRSMIDAAAGGALMEKTPTEAHRLVSTMAANTQQFGSRRDDMPRRVNEISNASSIEKQLQDTNKQLGALTFLLKNQAGYNGVCSICASSAHTEAECPEDTTKPVEINALANGPNFPPPRKYDPYAPTYNPGWRDHPNLRYGNSQAPHQPNGFQARPQLLQRPPMPQSHPDQSSSSVLKLEELVTQLTKNTLSFQDSTKSQMTQMQTAMDVMQRQLGQLASELGEFKNRGQPHLPSQPIVNPRENVSAITLRSGKVLHMPYPTSHSNEEAMGTIEDQVPHPTIKKGKEAITLDESFPKDMMPSGDPSTSTKTNPPNPQPSTQNTPITKPLMAPFPSRLVKPSKDSLDPEIMATFQKVQVNIPLLDAIQQIPKYAKFLKQLCTNKKRLQGKVILSDNISAIIQRTIPPKCKDPGVFSVPCSLGDVYIENAMIDLGAALSVMPYSTYSKLNIGRLSPTDVVLQLADRSLVYPEGVLEDVLIRVQHLIFPTDIYIIKMEDDSPSTSCSLLLGRPFLKTAHTKIDVFNGSLTMECDGKVISFRIPNTILSSTKDPSFMVNAIQKSKRHKYWWQSLWRSCFSTHPPPPP